MEFLNTFLFMLGEMSPYILLGFLVAGLLHAFVPAGLMSRHLSGTGPSSVIKGALIGVPLPLCSCGVLPTAVALHRQGASRASSSAFLIATPQTGVDSIAATWSMLGPAFALIRPVAALITSVAGGLIVGRTEKSETASEVKACIVGADEVQPRSFAQKCREAIVYGFHTMVGSIGKWLVIGLVVATLITMFVPENFLASLGAHPLLAMLAMVVIAVPMYVCATGSIPIALSLILKGLSPGAAFVLLMAGPAANFASIAVISRAMGRRAAAAYLGSIVVGAIAFGLLIDYLLPRSWFVAAGTSAHAACHHAMPLFDAICSTLLVALLAAAFIPRFFKRSPKQNLSAMTTIYKIKGMSCGHCKASVEKNLSRLPGVESVTVDLSEGTAAVEGEHSREDALRLIEEIGFEPTGVL